MAVNRDDLAFDDLAADDPRLHGRRRMEKPLLNRYMEGLRTAGME